MIRNIVIASRGFRSSSARGVGRSVAASSSPVLAEQRLVPSAGRPGVVATPAALPRPPASSVRRPLSSSHDDFAPQKKASADLADADAVRDLIDGHVKAHRVMVYMKGTPSAPQCGFSATVVDLLKRSGADFSSVNVLDYPEIREGVKRYAQWPTIPQVYVDGEFVGGCDIVQDLDASGELRSLVRGPGEEGEGDDDAGGTSAEKA